MLKVYNWANLLSCPVIRGVEVSPLDGSVVHPPFKHSMGTSSNQMSGFFLLVFLSSSNRLPFSFVILALDLPCLLCKGIPRDYQLKSMIHKFVLLETSIYTLLNSVQLEDTDVLVILLVEGG